MKKLGTICYIIMVCILITVLMSVSVGATNTYIKDNTGTLNSGIIERVNKNFDKLYTTTKVQARILMVNSKNDKNIASAENNLGNKEALFIIAKNDHKNRFIVGHGLNAVFDKNELNRISSVPNSAFKGGNFNEGVLEIGEAIDKDITNKAIKNGDAKVISDGYSNTVVAKKSHTGLIIAIILALLIIAGVIYYLKKKSDKEVRDFARKNNIRYEDKSGLGFKSANLGDKEETKDEPTHRHKPLSEYDFMSDKGYEPKEHYTPTSHGTIHSHSQFTPHHTTVVNNNYGRNDNSLVEGMILGSMLEDHHDHEYRHEPEYVPEPEPEKHEDNSCGDWDSGSSDYSSNDNSYGSGSSDWGSSSSDYDSGSSDFGSNDCGGSDW